MQNKKNIYYDLGQARSQGIFMEQNSTASYSLYYQLCAYINPRDNMYHLRKLVFNQKNQIIQEKQYRLTKKQVKNFVKTKRNYEYKCFPAYSLDYIDYPNTGDLLMSKSAILSGNPEYTGYAPY